MKVSSSIQPKVYVVERNGLYCTITLCANITFSTTNIGGKDTTVYTYDKYVITRQRYRANLEADIKANFDEWVTKGSNAEESTEAQKVRDYRDNLLNVCDLKHCNPEKWMAMSDTEKLAWAAYKQSLRDIPTQDNFPYTVNWPVMPADTKGKLRDALAAQREEKEQIAFSEAAQLSMQAYMAQGGSTS